MFVPTQLIFFVSIKFLCSYLLQTATSGAVIIYFRGIVKSLPCPIAFTRGRGILNLWYYVLGGISTSNKYRDPIHGFIEVSDLENKIIDSRPFQRLRNIKQLAMTYMVFHGAEHTRFGHSLGVMHLVTKAFSAAVENGKDVYQFSEEKKKWYIQILRLIALTHDIGHAPFSHASESVFPEGLEHEAFTEKIIKETSIAEYITQIGAEFREKLGPQYDITPDLICDIYLGRNPGECSEFTFLKSFMDSELDCDKMDYLLRDSTFCGVNYGRYDIERLISSLTIYVQDGCPRLAISDGGVQAFEEFVLARYFMFIQVYFHRTRRYFDIMFYRALKDVLPDGKYPDNTNDYLKWDDTRVVQSMQDKENQSEACYNIVNRVIYPCVNHTKTHPDAADKREFRLIERELFQKFGEDNFIEDVSADKMPHKIPTKTEITDEHAIVIIDKSTGKCSTISENSHIIESLTDKIDIERLYVKPSLKTEVLAAIQRIYSDIQK